MIWFIRRSQRNPCIKNYGIGQIRFTRNTVWCQDKLPTACSTCRAAERRGILLFLLMLRFSALSVQDLLFPTRTSLLFRQGINRKLEAFDSHFRIRRILFSLMDRNRTLSIRCLLYQVLLNFKIPTNNCGCSLVFELVFWGIHVCSHIRL